MIGKSPGPELVSLREEQIVAATRTLFLRYGYRRTSVDDIAREAGVAKATLYLHFAGKEDMFRAMIRRFRMEMHDRCHAAEALRAPFAERLSALLHASLGTTLEWFGDAAHLGELKAFASEHPIGPFDDAAPAFRDRVRHVLEAAVDSGEISPAADAPSIAEIVQTVMFAAHGIKQSCKDGTASLRPAIDSLVCVVAFGLRAPAAGRRPPSRPESRSKSAPGAWSG